MSNPKLNFKEETSAKKTRSPPEKAKVEQTQPKKKKLKLDTDKAKEKAQHLRFGKAELTPDDLRRLSKEQKREMYAAALARSAAHREIDQYEEDNVGVQALSEGEKAAGNVQDFSKNRYSRKLKKKAKMQAKKKARTTKSSTRQPDKAQNAGDSSVFHGETSEGGSNWLSRWKQRQEIRKGYYAAARSGSTAAQTAGSKKAASSGTSATRTGVEQVIDKGKSAVGTAINGLATAAKSNAHVLIIVGVFLLLILLVMSGFSSCGILFSGTTQVSGQTIYTAEDRDIKGAEADYKKLEKELDKKIKRTPTDHPGYNEYQYHLDPIEHDPWQLTSFLTTLYDDYTRSEVQAKLQEIFKKQYKLTTWVEVQIRYKTVWVISPAGIPVPTQVPYEYKIFHTKLENRGLEAVIREELDDDQWKRYKIFQETLGGRPYLFNGGLPPGDSDGSGESGIDYAVPAEALTDNGRYHVFDGQNTIEARVACNGGRDLPILCKVFHGLSKKDEALLFAVQTGISTDLTAGERLRADIVAEDEDACAFVAATEATGATFALDGIRAEWKIYCIRSAYYIYKNYGSDIYQEALKIIVEAWWGDSDSFLSGILHGVTRFVAMYRDEYSRERLIMRLGSVHPKTITKNARKDTGNIADRHMKQILEIYNGSSRSLSLPVKR